MYYFLEGSLKISPAISMAVSFSIKSESKLYCSVSQCSKNKSKSILIVSPDKKNALVNKGLM